MRFALFVFISTSVGLLIPRCDTHSEALTSIDVRELDQSSSATTTSVLPLKSSYVKKIKTPPTKPAKSSIVTTTPSPIRAATVETSSSGAACTPHSICEDKISPCGRRYGGCYDENFCDGNTSPYPIPTCPTMVTKKREAVVQPTVTPA